MSLIHWKSGNSIPVSQLASSRFTPLFSLQDEINHLFDGMFSIPRTSLLQADKNSAINLPSVDVIEDDKGYKIQAELPGLDAKQVDISTANGFLTIKGEKKEEKEEKNTNYIRRESSFGMFQRTIALPESADDEKAQATFKNGVLTIEIPKKACAQACARKINVNDAA